MQKKFLIIFLSIILTTFFVTMYSQNGTINAQSYDGEGYLYFFQGGNYIKYDYSSNKQISLNGYPRKIESSWPGLDKFLMANNIDTAFKSADGKNIFL